MKKLFLSIISLALAGGAYAQLNTFSDGDTISAEKMNQNFQHLEQQFRGTRTTTVNCAAGEKIGDAIDNGYINITVSGTCAENLQFSMWREDSAENKTPTGKLAPRFLKIAGADSDAKIIDTSSNTESTISVNSGATLFMNNITVSGGQYGINAQRNSNLYLSGVTVENFTERGIRVADSAWLGIDEDGATIIGTENSTGIELVTGASGWIYSVNISNVDRGLNVYGGSMVYLNSYQISAISRGITVANSHVLNLGDGSASIEGTSDRAVSVSYGVFLNERGNTLEIKNLKGGRGISFWKSQGDISNLKMLDFDITGSGESAISISRTAAVSFQNIEISGSCNDNFIGVDGGSSAEIRDSTIVSTSTGRGINVVGNSYLEFRNSTISGTATDGNLVNIGSGSSAEIRDSTISGTATNDSLVSTNGGSYAKIRDSNVSWTVTGGDMMSVSSGSSVHLRGSTISGTASVDSMSLLYVRKGSSTGAVSCSGKSYASANDSTVPTLPDSCTQ